MFSWYWKFYPCSGVFCVRKPGHALEGTLGEYETPAATHQALIRDGTANSQRHWALACPEAVVVSLRPSVESPR